jgi:hypothetical protein
MGSQPWQQQLASDKKGIVRLQETDLRKAAIG